MPITTMSSVWYPIQNWERAKQFYTEVLGLTLGACNDDAGWAALQVGGSGPAFFLVRKPELAGRGGGAVVGFSVTEAPGLLERIRAFGARVDEHIQESDTVRIYTIYDPDGNALELSEERKVLL